MPARRRRPADPFDALEARMAADGDRFRPVRADRYSTGSAGRRQCPPVTCGRFAESRAQLRPRAPRLRRPVPAGGRGTGLPGGGWAIADSRLQPEPRHLPAAALGRPDGARCCASRIAWMAGPRWRRPAPSRAGSWPSSRPWAIACLSGFEYEFYLVERDHPAAGLPRRPDVLDAPQQLRRGARVPQVMRGMSAVGVDIITANAEARARADGDQLRARRPASTPPITPSPSRTA